MFVVCSWFSSTTSIKNILLLSAYLSVLLRPTPTTTPPPPTTTTTSSTTRRWQRLRTRNVNRSNGSDDDDGKFSNFWCLWNVARTTTIEWLCDTLILASCYWPRLTWSELNLTWPKLKAITTTTGTASTITATTTLKWTSLRSSWNVKMSSGGTFVDRIDPFAKRSLKKKQRKSQGSSRYRTGGDVELTPLPLLKGKSDHRVVLKFYVDPILTLLQVPLKSSVTRFDIISLLWQNFQCPLQNF